MPVLSVVMGGPWPRTMTAAALRGAVRRLPYLWGAVVAATICRHLFTYGPGEMHVNHEGYSYVYRVIAFLDLLRAGYVFPTWVVDFREGLGSPYFGYYQPGFFYLASAFAAFLPVLQAMAVTLTLLAWVGYAGVYALVAPRFGVLAGVLGGTTLLASPYARRSELYLRGDLSEFAGMMLLPPALHWLVSWLEGGRRRHLGLLALNAGALVVTHPVAGLAGYGAMAVVTAVWAAMDADRRRAAAVAGALVAGVGIAGFHLGPVALEWRLVNGSRLATAFDFREHFADLSGLLGWGPERRIALMPLGIGRLAAGLALVGVATSLARWAWLAPDRRRLLVAMLVLGAGTAFFMHEASVVLWENAPLLAFVQFPWRFLLVLTTVGAILSGCLGAGGRVVPLVGITLHALMMLGDARPPRESGWLHPATPRAIGHGYVSPDAAHEWMPRGAKRYPRGAAPRVPVCTGCSVGSYARHAGRVRAVVLVAKQPAELLLPHYWFPVGWHATNAGQPIPIEANQRGLMRLRPVATGEVDVRFGTTPGRRIGVAVSVVSLVLLAAWLSRLPSRG